VEAGHSQRAQLMPPGIPAFGKAMTQQDRRSISLLCDVHADAIGFDDPMLCLGYCHLGPIPLISFRRRPSGKGTMEAESEYAPERVTTAMIIFDNPFLASKAESACVTRSLRG
jgi:hypothetical protein